MNTKTVYVIRFKSSGKYHAYGKQTGYGPVLTEVDDPFAAKTFYSLEEARAEHQRQAHLYRREAEAVPILMELGRPRKMRVLTEGQFRAQFAD